LAGYSRCFLNAGQKRRVPMKKLFWPELKKSGDPFRKQWQTQRKTPKTFGVSGWKPPSQDTIWKDHDPALDRSKKRETLGNLGNWEGPMFSTNWFQMNLGFDQWRIILCWNIRKIWHALVETVQCRGYGYLGKFARFIVSTGSTRMTVGIRFSWYSSLFHLGP
jgi:hypothetical protein